MTRKLIFSLTISAALVAFFLLAPLNLFAATAAPLYKLEKPPLGERWFSILINDEQVGFYRQNIIALPNGGYLIEGNGSVRMKVMGFEKESSSRESYMTGSNLALRTFEVEQTVNGNSSRLTGKLIQGGLQVKREADGKSTVRVLKARSIIYPGPAINLVPLLINAAEGKVYKVLTFDPEELMVKDVMISVMGEEKTPEGLSALKLRNNLYPFVNNDIWVDRNGNTLLESVRDGLVITRSETAVKMAGFISKMALAKKDLIYDFSLIRLDKPLKAAPARLAGLSVLIEGYGEQIPLINDGWQEAERQQGGVLIKTGSLRTSILPSKKTLPEGYLSASEGIESDTAAIISKSKELTDNLKTDDEKVRILSKWTAAWLEDTVEDGGSALESLPKKQGNCQTHARLYTAIARAAGIPTRFVSGLVSKNGRDFLYHSWAESLIDWAWVAVDPTFDQVPADVTHLAFFEGNRLSDLSPLVGIIGKIKIVILKEE